MATCILHVNVLGVEHLPQSNLCSCGGAREGGREDRHVILVVGPLEVDTQHSDSTGSGDSGGVPKPPKEEGRSVALDVTALPADEVLRVKAYGKRWLKRDALRGVGSIPLDNLIGSCQSRTTTPGSSSSSVAAFSSPRQEVRVPLFGGPRLRRKEGEAVLVLHYRTLPLASYPES